VTTPLEPPAGLDPAQLAEVLAQVRSQIAAALWLSAGMVLAQAGFACLAAGWRRPALALGLLYSATLCFVPNGHAEILGPVGGAIAVAGLLRPRRSRAP